MSVQRVDEVPIQLLESLETIVFEAIGITAAVLAEIDMADLTLAQWRLLVIVGHEESIRVGRIAALMTSSTTSTSRLISRLERRGYVATQRDDRDRRATLVSLTPAGHDLRERIIQIRRQKLANAVALGDPLPDRLDDGLIELSKRLSDYA